MAKVVAGIAAQKHMLSLLCKRELSKRQIAELTGIQHVTICRWIETYSRGPENLLYISRWKRCATSGPYTAFYSFGYCKENVPRPLPLTKKQKNINTRRRLRTIQLSQGIIQHVSI